MGCFPYKITESLETEGNYTEMNAYMKERSAVFMPVSNRFTDSQAARIQTTGA